MKILEDQDIEFQRILNEIKSKNGLPFGTETNLEGTRSNKNSSYSMDGHYMNYQLPASRGRGGKDKKKRQSGDEKRVQKIKSKSPIKTEQEAKPQGVTVPDQASGKPAFIQSTYGNKGNFELVVPVAGGGLAHYSRNNDLEGLPWSGPVRFGIEAGLIAGASLIQGDFGSSGNLEVIATDSEGLNLLHFWRDSGPSYNWNGPICITDESLDCAFAGSPAMIWSNFGRRGNFDVIVPRADGGFYYYWRENDDPDLTWQGPFEFAADAGRFEALTLIQSNFGDPGNLEMVARSGNKLAFFWRDSWPELKWNGPEIIASGVTGEPSMIQSSFGNKGNFELVVPLELGGLAYYWRDNDDDNLKWVGPFMFGLNMGKVESVSLIQSNFGDPGHLEIVAQADGQLAFFWRDSGPDFRWNGPQYLTI